MTTTTTNYNYSNDIFLSLYYIIKKIASNITITSTPLGVVAITITTTFPTAITTNITITITITNNKTTEHS